MTFQQWLLLSLIALVSAPGVLPGQTIWPGDVNNNGVVNEVDLLYLGWAFGAAGPERPAATTDWEPQAAPAPWSQAFPDGLNYYYADVDGNGFVEEEDLDDGLEDNYGLTHGAPLGDGFANAAPGSGAALQLAPAANIVGLGEMITIDLFVDQADQPLPPTYGFALQLSFGARQGSMMGELEFETADGNWLEGSDDALLELDETDESTGQGSLALVRTDQQVVAPGNDKIGSYSVIIEDIVVGLEADTFWIRIDSIRLVGADFQTFPVVPTEPMVVVARNPDSLLLSAVPGLSEERLRIYPNPARSGTVWVESTVDIGSWQLISATGQQLPLNPQPAGHRRWRLSWPPGLPAGTYVLVGRGPEGLLREQLIKLPN
jgi:hypothetical protein